MAQATKRYAVVTGSNKGIGLEICRQLASKGITVVLTARDEKRGLEALEKLTGSVPLDSVIFHRLDVTDSASVVSLAEFIKSQFGKLDILVNNAGILGVITNSDVVERLLRTVMRLEEPKPNNRDMITETYDLAVECIQTNYYGAKRTTEALLPLLEISDSPRIVNVSSIMGILKHIPSEWAKRVLHDTESLTEERIDQVINEFLKDFKKDSIVVNGWPQLFGAYVVSKASMNAYTWILANKYPSFRINSVCPGYVKTDITFNTGIYSAEDGAKNPVRLALLPDDGPSGLFFIRNEYGEAKPKRTTYELAAECLQINYYGLKETTEKLIPLLELSDSPRIVNVSSTMGRLSGIRNKWARGILEDAENLTEERIDQVLHEFLQDFKDDAAEAKGWPSYWSAYCVSKAAVTAYTRLLAKKYSRMLINSVSPGWVNSDLSNHSGPLTPEEGARSPVRLALLPNGGPSGLFFDRMHESSF